MTSTPHNERPEDEDEDGIVQIHGTRPLKLIEKIVLTRIWDSPYWKEETFGVSTATLIDKAVEITSIGGTYGNQRVTNFLCLVAKLLMLQPEIDIIEEYIKDEDFKYLRALGAFYIRLVGTPVQVYTLLEPLLNDYRKLRYRGRTGYKIICMDEFADDLLTQERVCDIILPRITQRHALEELGDLQPRVSKLEGELLENMESEEDSGDKDENDKMIEDSAESSKKSATAELLSRTANSATVSEHSVTTKTKSESKSTEFELGAKKPKHYKSSKVSKLFSKKFEPTDEDFAELEQASTSKKNKNEEKAKGDSLSIDETNKIRAQLGLAPLK